MSTDQAKRNVNFAQNAFRAHWAPLRRFLAKRIGTQEVDDLAQEVFARMLRIEDIELVRNPFAYLLGIATHVVCEFRQRTTGDRIIFDSDLADSIGAVTEDYGASALSLRHELRNDIEGALQRLPATHRLIFLLVKRDGMSYAEAAEKTGLSVHTVQKYLVEARAQLRMALADSRR